MTSADTAVRKTDMNVVISNLLKYGVIASTALVVLGVILTFARLPSSFPTSIQQMVSTDYGKPTVDIGQLFSGVAAANPSSILQLGLLILLATPVARVAASLILFAAEHDRIYVVITLFVLLVLLTSIFLIGPLEAAMS
jgi:uncharacterized membrane protein